jgi:hypothetical protein
MADDPEFAVCKIAHVIRHDIDVSQSCDVKDLDEQVYRCIAACRSAIENGMLPGYTDFERVLIWNFIEGMRYSHASVRTLLSGEQSGSAVDALAIARLQVENVFTACLLLQSPEFVRLLLKNAWKKKYVNFLLHRAEYSLLPRFNEWGPKTEHGLGQLQSVSFVSDDERQTIEFQQLGNVPKPDPMVPIRGFPTPAIAVKRVSDPDQKRMLARLNADYEFLCSFAHGDGEAVIRRTLSDKRSPFNALFPTSQLEKVYQEQVLEPPLVYSALASVIVATEVAAAMPTQVDLRATLMNAWNFIIRTNLMGVPAWESRAKRVFGVLGV